MKQRAEANIENMHDFWSTSKYCAKANSQLDFLLLFLFVFLFNQKTRTNWLGKVERQDDILNGEIDESLYVFRVHRTPAAPLVEYLIFVCFIFSYIFISLIRQFNAASLFPHCFFLCVSVRSFLFLSYHSIHSLLAHFISIVCLLYIACLYEGGLFVRF